MNRDWLLVTYILAISGCCCFTSATEEDVTAYNMNDHFVFESELMFLCLVRYVIVYIGIYVRTYVCVHIGMYKSVCTYVCMCVHAFVCVHVCMCTISVYSYYICGSTILIQLTIQYIQST